MKRTLILGSVIVAGLVTMTVVGQQAPPPGAPAAGGGPRAGGGGNPVGMIEKIADNLYRIPGAGGHSAVWVRSDGVLLVDTKLANNGQSLTDQIRSVTDKPITHIVNTHTHGDHTGSNMFFPASVEIVTQVNTKTNMEKLEAFKSETGKVGLPDRTFKDKLTLFRGRDAVDLYYFGAAHTNGDAIVVFRAARVAHAGDMFPAKAQPLLDVNNGGSGLTYDATIAKAFKGIRNVDRVITGHSNVFSWQEFSEYGEFNRLFLQHARDSLAAGKTPEQAMIDFKLPAKFEGYALAPTRGGPAGNFTILFGELQKK